MAEHTFFQTGQSRSKSVTSILAWARSSGRSRVGYATLAVTGALLCSSPLSGEVRNIATDWLTFWDATRGQPTPERVAVFKRDVASKFPAFYAASRFPVPNPLLSSSRT